MNDEENFERNDRLPSPNVPAASPQGSLAQHQATSRPATTRCYPNGSSPQKP